MSVYLALPLAGMFCFVCGFAFGWPALRLGTVHLLLATWGLAVSLPQFLRLSYFEKWTGGVSGVYLDRPATPFGLPLSNDQWWHFVTLIVLLLMFPAARSCRECFPASSRYRCGAGRACEAADPVR